MARWPYNTQRWQRLRKLKLATQPLCETCLPRPVVGKHVDHRVAISKGGDPYPPLSGLSVYCASCHSRKTNHIDMQGKASVPARGVNPDGTPKAGSGHWWASS